MATISCCCRNDDEGEGDAGTGWGQSACGVPTEGGRPNDEEDFLCVNGCQVQVG